MDLDPKISEEIPETEPSKKRKMSQKTVVAVKMEENENKKHKSEGPPADSWSWRKYGQKPIKGSPYPRGYYRCSTSKSCLAKKQVERCRTDASLLLITYTSSHNHPSPKEQKEEEEQGEEPENQISQKNSNIIVTVQKQDPNKAEGAKEQVSFFNDDGATSNFHYIHSPLNGSDQDIITNIKNEEEMGLTENLVVFDEREKPLCYPHLMTFSTPKSEENDFFDELEELPTSSSFTSFMRGNFFEDRILIHLSNF